MTIRIYWREKNRRIKPAIIHSFHQNIVHAESGFLTTILQRNTKILYFNLLKSISLLHSKMISMKMHLFETCHKK